MAEAAPFAEVIGDPVAHSFSPAIHNFWLDQLGIHVRFEATRCTPDRLAPFLRRRRHDASWRGCSVTMPLKGRVAPLLDNLDPSAAATGAVNCILPRDGLAGFNTDVDGIAAALRGASLTGQRAIVIGAGGAARAALFALIRRGATPVVLARSSASALPLAALAPDLQVLPLENPGKALEGAAAVINATPLGMRGKPAMPESLLANLPDAAGAVAVDMVYRPLRTPFVDAAEAAGLIAVDGLVMLIGQARRAFELFFGVAPPPGDEALRVRLTSSLPAD